MHYWRLLLLSFLAVLQPIASFTERNLVDGREQCCDRDSVLWDSKVSYGFRLNKLPEARRLSRVEVRDDRRYEARRENPVLIRSLSDRRLTEFRSDSNERQERERYSPENTARLVRPEIRREFSDNRRERQSTLREDRESLVRGTRRTSVQNDNRGLRERDDSRVRRSKESNIRHHDRDAFESSRTRASRNHNFEYRSRISMESRRNRDNSNERSVQGSSREAREVLQRARNDVARREMLGNRQDRRVVGERVEERRERMISRLQSNNRERLSLNRRVRDDNDERRSRSVDRLRELREESRLNVRNERDVLQRINSRREISKMFDERRLHRDEFRAARGVPVSDRQESRDRALNERRDAREAVDRSRNVGGRNVRVEQFRAARDMPISVRQESRDRALNERRDARETVDRSRSVVGRNVRVEHAEFRRDSRRDRVDSRNERAASESRRVESRNVLDREFRHRDVAMDHRDHRSAERRDMRDTRREIRMNKDLNTRERGITQTRAQFREGENLERDARFRTNTEYLRSRETVASIREKIQPGDQTSTMNWQYIFYTLQGMYICGVLMQMLSHKDNEKAPRGFAWLSATPSLIKVD